MEQDALAAGVPVLHGLARPDLSSPRNATPPVLSQDLAGPRRVDRRPTPGARTGLFGRRFTHDGEAPSTENFSVVRQEGMRLTLNEQGLTAFTLLIAENDPKAKGPMVRLVMNLIVDDIGGASEGKTSTNKHRLLGAPAL